MAEAQVNVQVSGQVGSAELRQRLQEVVDGNRIAMNLRMQARITTIKAQRG
jgi:hypothetical protein